MTTPIDPRSLLERVAALEEAIKHLASKEDLERVRAELLLAIERVQASSDRAQAELFLAIGRVQANLERVEANSDRAQARHIRWTVGTIVATGALVVAAIKLL